MSQFLLYVLTVAYTYSWASLFAVAQMSGQFAGGFLSDRFGRRPTLYSVIFWTYIGVMLEVGFN